jgi:hypothetical protein
MTPGAIDVYRRQIEKELQAGNATAGGADIGFHVADPGDPPTAGARRPLRPGAYIQRNVRTTGGYFDNPAIRGTRCSLMKVPTEIYGLDLHGNSRKKERAPDGPPHENVSDIQQGLALGILPAPPQNEALPLKTVLAARAQAGEGVVV